MTFLIIAIYLIKKIFKNKIKKIFTYYLYIIIIVTFLIIVIYFITKNN